MKDKAKIFLKVKKWLISHRETITPMPVLFFFNNKPWKQKEDRITHFHVLKERSVNSEFYVQC